MAALASSHRLCRFLLHNTSEKSTPQRHIRCRLVMSVPRINNVVRLSHLDGSSNGITSRSHKARIAKELCKQNWIMSTLFRELTSAPTEHLGVRLVVDAVWAKSVHDVEIIREDTPLIPQEYLLIATKSVPVNSRRIHVNE